MSLRYLVLGLLDEEEMRFVGPRRGPEIARDTTSWCAQVLHLLPLKTEFSDRGSDSAGRKYVAPL